MPEVKYNRDTQRFDVVGVDLNRPVDSVKPGKFPYLRNMRSYQAGRIEPRMGVTDLGVVVAGQSPVHSVRRLNDPFTNTWRRIIGTGTHLATGQTFPFTDLDSGYSGDPLALQPWKPPNAPDAYMYVADRLRMRKTNVAQTLDTIGYPAPANPPTIALQDTPSYKDIDLFDSLTGWTWVQTPAAGATVPTIITRTTAIIAGIAYDTGTTGWASIALDNTQGIGYGERLNYNPGGGNSETATVQRAFPGSPPNVGTGWVAPTTINGVVYESGTTGQCSVVLTTPSDQVFCDALIRNITTGEYARIIAAIEGPDGTKSIRLNTTTSWNAGASVQVAASHRVYLVNTHVVGETVSTDATFTSITGAATGTYTKTNPFDPITGTTPLNLSIIVAGVQSHPDDYMHIGFKVSTATAITEVKVLLDVDSSVNDFTRNFYYRALRVSDLTPSASNTETLLQTQQDIASNQVLDSSFAIDPSIQTQAISEGRTLLTTSLGRPIGILPEGVTAVPTSPATSSTAPSVQSEQLPSGEQVWVDVAFRLSELIRVGADITRTLQNVAAIRIQYTTTASATLSFDSWWIGGGYGPDSGDTTATSYYYRYRVRNPRTGVPSNFSPATQHYLSPMRQFNTVTMPQYIPPAGTTLTTDNFVLDIDRFGGQITDWHYVGTVANSASPGFVDKQDDDVIAGNPIQANDNYEAWPTLGVPVSGTTGNVAGTFVEDSGANFSLSWAPGTRILIDNLPFVIYRVLSTFLLEVTTNAARASSTAWRIDEPTILATPLPCLWHWDDRFWACGDTANPGRLYYSNPNSETTTPTNYIDVTSPSEPLQNGLNYNIRGYVFGSESFNQILSTGNPESPYRSESIPNGKGLYSRWWLTREPSPVICFGSRDGICMTVGGAPISLTDADLYLLFPNEGNPGQIVNGIPGPSILPTDSPFLRLTYYDEFMYFDYMRLSTTPTISGVSATGTIGTVGVTTESSGGFVPCSGFTNVHGIQIDRTKLPTTQTNFPMLISVTNADFKTIGNGGFVTSSDGFDIRPSLTDCTTLTFELEQSSYDPTTGTFLMWILMPTVNGMDQSTNTTIQLNFGNSSLTTDGSSVAVWSGYLSVLHFNTFTNGLNCMRDSAKDLTPNDWVNYLGPVTQVTGEIGNCGSYSGADEFRNQGSCTIDAGCRPFIDQQDGTAAFWIKTSTNSRFILGKVSFLVCDVGLNNSLWYAMVNSSGQIYTEFRNQGWTQTQLVTGSSSVSDNNWHQIVITRAGTVVKIYVDGVLDKTDTNANTINITEGGGSLEIGTIGFGHCGSYFIGLIDEVELNPSIARSQDWITAAYNNQSSPATFAILI